MGPSHDRSGDRTHDLKIKSLLLYQLSYPVFRTERDGMAALTRVQVKRSSRVTRRPADEGAKLALRRRMRIPATESPALAAAPTGASAPPGRRSFNAGLNASVPA